MWCEDQKNPQDPTRILRIAPSSFTLTPSLAHEKRLYVLGQVFWLWDRPTPQAFPETFRFPVVCPEFRPPLQRRDRMGIAPISLFVHVTRT